MKQFQYAGSMVTCLPLKTGDVILHPGKTVELPETVGVVRTLAAKGLLVLVPVPAAPERPGTATETAEKPSRKNKESA